MKMIDIFFDFTGKTVVVTGGSKGIGLEVVKRFIDSGAVVYCLSRTDPKIDGCHHIGCNLRNQLSIKLAFDSIKTLDFLINVAGTNLCCPIEDIDSDEWDRVMSTNLKSFYYTSKLAVQIMKQKKLWQDCKCFINRRKK